ncbi:aminopeptidase N [Boudabousia liubingyangii]|uniref:aminopeptidase N n=1 Tax=Boudabousia liubingyangii TaxID=1921764 RepID=UPI00093D71B9|nr:aminopeptidase N [Boudabousia liubingyangii]OKL47707.1 aminopeptidase N [Boudabousia liubingyangii]
MTLTQVEAQNRSEQITVDNYRISLDLTHATSSNTFPSQATVTFHSKAPETHLDLVAEQVTSVKVNGAETEVDFRDDRVYLSGLDTERLNEVTVEALCIYSRTGEGLHRYHDPEDGRYYLYTQYEPFDAHRVYACFDQPDLKGTWDFELTGPESWSLLSNGAEIERETWETEDHIKVQTCRFAQTKRLSSYITAVIAGEYQKFDGGVWKSEDGDLQIPLGLYCRQTLAADFDTEDVFEVTRQGLEFFNNAYQFPYPWGKYDQIYVPEYNLGAMENPGCITFNEKMIVRGGPSRTQRSNRANTILHEMCHMWFGDLVTPRWWDDLWLKESFADNQGYFAEQEATQYTESFTTFAAARKSWAYTQDLRPTTHPIMAEIPDLDAAKQNFDGITYAKGSAVLTQLMVHLGRENFFGAARRYFQKHAFQAASFSDLIAALEEQTGRDLGPWVKVWLQTAGPSVIRATREGREFVLHQAGVPIEGHPETGKTIRPHTFTIAFFAANATEPFSVREVTMEAETLRLDLTEGEAAATMIVPNAGDETYALIELDAVSQASAMAGLLEIADTRIRAVIWQSLWMGVYNGRIDPAAFALAAVESASTEELGILREINLVRSVQVISHFLPRQRWAATAQPSLKLISSQVQDELEASPVDVDRARSWINAYAQLLRLHPTEEGLKELTELLEAHPEVINPALKWTILTTLAATGKLSQSELESHASGDQSGETQVFLATAKAAIPSLEVKQAAWKSALSGELSNEMFSATLEGINQASQYELLADLREDFFQQLESFWNNNSIGMGTRYVTQAFPSSPDLSAGVGTENELVKRTDQWLSEHQQASHALLRLVKEKRDDLVRYLRAQENA